MASNPNLFTETLRSMESGDTLMLMGGTFPAQGKSADVLVGLSKIIPIMHIVTGRDQYAPHDNPLFGPDDEEPVTLRLERNDRRFGHDYGEGADISFGKRAGMILGQCVDIVILNPLNWDCIYFIGKPADE